MKYAALCCTAKDEDLYLKEWLAYHALIGFEHFIIYDNCSKRPIASLLEGFADNNLVTVIRHEEEKPQSVSYTHCLNAFGREHVWIAFLDVDEFIRLRDTDDIRIFLGEYEGHAGLGLTWRMFSSNGHETTPASPVIASYTRYLEDNMHIKSIVQPFMTKRYLNPHAFMPVKGRSCVDTNRFPIPLNVPYTIPRTEKAWINHYFYKSRQCFAAKVARGNPCDIERSMAAFDEHLDRRAKKDLGMLPYVAAVTSTLHKDRLEAPKLPPFLKALEPGKGVRQTLFAETESLLESGRTDLARLCLCYASCYVDADNGAANRLWTLRAKAALADLRIDDAERHLAYALTFGVSISTYACLAELLMRQDKTEDARYLLDIIKACKNMPS